MEIDSLPNVVLMLVFVGMMIGIGLLIFSNFGDAAATTDVITNESITMPAQGANVSLANGNLTVFTQLLAGNGTALETTNYTTFTTTGEIEYLGNASVCNQGDTCYAYYTHTNYVTPTNTEMTSMVSAVGAISTTWMSLIVTVVVLALILVLVIRSFGGARR